MGHRSGVEAARRVVEAAPDLGVGILTLFAFSSDNWRRPPVEVEALMRLMAAYLENETERCIRNGVRLEVIGRRDRLDHKLREAIDRLSKATQRLAELNMNSAIRVALKDKRVREIQ